MATLDAVKCDAGSDQEFVGKWCGEHGDGLRFGSQLIVNHGQEAVFVKGGQTLDVFGPGTYTLSSGNLPLLSQLISMPFGGAGPFSAEVWFINRTVKRDLRWGTKARIPVVDPSFDFPVSIGAFGRWGVRIADSLGFVSRLVGSQIGADSDRIVEYFIGKILQQMSEIIATCVVGQRVPVTELMSRLGELSSAASSAIGRELARFGVEVVNFDIESINIPPDEY